MIVLTAHFGDEDPLFDPCTFSDRCRYICYTDREDLASDVWDIRCLHGSLVWDDARLQARFLKIMAPLHFPCKDILWIDGTIQLRKKPEDFLLPHLRQHTVLAMPHPHRDTVEEEAEVLASRYGWDRRPFDKQIASYRRQGWKPERTGWLTTTGLLAFGGTTVSQDLACAWWKEIKEWGHPRDQMSFDFAAWKTGSKVGLLYGHYRNNPYARYWAHGGKRTKKMRISHCEKEGRTFVNAPSR
jgi:hypothetical protein